jgi:mono/diheme cytochrome c family protein
MPSRRGKGIVAVLATTAMMVLVICGARQPRPRPSIEIRPTPAPRQRGRSRAWAICALALVLLLGGAAAVYGLQQQRAAEHWAAALTGGDPDRAPALIVRNGCAGCHTISGVSGARGSVGPTLSGLADRAFIGGTLPNTPKNLVRWIRDSRGVNPRTAMPSTRISDSEAHDIAAYLYALPSLP